MHSLIRSSMLSIPTIHYDLFTLFKLHIVLCGTLYEHEIFGVPLPPSLHVFTLSGSWSCRLQLRVWALSQLLKGKHSGDVWIMQGEMETASAHKRHQP
jgi:hypothetical protein